VAEELRWEVPPPQRGTTHSARRVHSKDRVEKIKEISRGGALVVHARPCLLARSSSYPPEEEGQAPGATSTHTFRTLIRTTRDRFKCA
jgi:hypothetical protein